MKSLFLPVCMRIFGMGKKTAGRQVLRTAPLEQRRHLERVFCALNVPLRCDRMKMCALAIPVSRRILYQTGK